MKTINFLAIAIIAFLLTISFSSYLFSNDLTSETICQCCDSMCSEKECYNCSGSAQGSSICCPDQCTNSECIDCCENGKCSVTVNSSLSHTNLNLNEVVRSVKQN